MGRTITYRQYLLTQKFTGLVVFCANMFNDDMALSLNNPLAHKLQVLSAFARTSRMEQLIAECLENMSESKLVQDIDVMFNPAYKIDVLQSLINVCKIKPFKLIWQDDLKTAS